MIMLENEMREEMDTSGNTSDKAGSTTVSTASETKKRWYILQATSGFEKKVKKSLEDRIALEGIEDFFGEILVPTEEVTEMRKDKKVKTERKLYPGYILLACELNDEIWHFVKKIPKVIGFIGGSNGRPTPISELEAQKIRDQMEVSAEKPKPKVLFEPGEVVRVNDGPFKDFNGVVEEVNYDKSRLRVAVLIFGRSTPVELEFGQVEKT
jgi:transcriptional antiterminator NusG